MTPFLISYTAIDSQKLVVSVNQEISE